MDIRGSTSTVTSIAELGAQVISALSNYASYSEEAAALCDGLRDHIRLCIIAEKAIRSIIQDTTPSSHTRTPNRQKLSREWSRPDAPPEQCRKQLEDLLKSIQHGGGQIKTKKNILARVKWHFRKQKIEAALRDFEVYKPFFIRILSILNINPLPTEREEQEKRDEEQANPIDPNGTRGLEIYEQVRVAELGVVG